MNYDLTQSTKTRREFLLSIEVNRLSQSLERLKYLYILSAISVLFACVAMTMVAYQQYLGPRIVIKDAGSGEIRPVWKMADEAERRRFLDLFLTRRIETDPRTIDFELPDVLNMMNTETRDQEKEKLIASKYRDRVVSQNIVTTFEASKIEPIQKKREYVFYVSGIKRIKPKDAPGETVFVRYGIVLGNSIRETRNYWYGLEVTGFQETVLSRQPDQPSSTAPA
jgi:hypothetical protein